MAAISPTFNVCAAAHDSGWQFSTFESVFQLHLTRALEHIATRYLSLRFEPPGQAQPPRLYLGLHADLEIYYWNGTDYVRGHLAPGAS